MVGKFIKNNWFYILGGVLILALFCLRFLHLTTLPVFADEAIYIRWSQVMRAEQTLRFLPLSDGKEPLFMWLVIPFLKLISNPLVAGRLVSILSGLGTMIGIGILTHTLFKNKLVTLVSLTLYALSPFIFFFDRLALADSLLSMFGVWTFIFAYLSFKKQRLDCALLAGFALGGAWLTKSPALFFAIMLPSLWLFVPWKEGIKKNVLIAAKTLGFSLVTVVVGYGFYNMLRLGPNFNLIASRNMDYVYPLSHILTRPLDPLKVFVIAGFRWIIAMGPWEILLLWIASYLITWRKYKKEALVLTIWFLLPFFIQSEFAKTFTARYILFSIPYLLILSSSTILSKNKMWTRIFIIGFCLFAAHSLFFNYQLLVNPSNADLPRSERSGYLEEWTAGQGISQTADYLIKKQQENPDQKIVIGTEGYFGTLPDGLQIYLNNFPSITAIGVGLDFEKLPSQLYNSKEFGNTTYLLVNASRFNNTAEGLGLRLIESFPKAVKPSGVTDSLLFFEVTDEALKIN